MVLKSCVGMKGYIYETPGGFLEQSRTGVKVKLKPEGSYFFLRWQDLLHQEVFIQGEYLYKF